MSTFSHLHDETALGHQFMPANQHLTRVEEEVVVLRAVKELVDSMVNFELLSVIGEDPHSQVLFKSDTHSAILPLGTTAHKRTGTR
jgi:hypothetical protein